MGVGAIGCRLSLVDYGYWYWSVMRAAVAFCRHFRGFHSVTMLLRMLEKSVGLLFWVSRWVHSTRVLEDVGDMWYADARSWHTWVQCKRLMLWSTRTNTDGRSCLRLYTPTKW